MDTKFIVNDLLENANVLPCYNSSVKELTTLAKIAPEGINAFLQKERFDRIRKVLPLFLNHWEKFNYGKIFGDDEFYLWLDQKWEGVTKDREDFARELLAEFLVTYLIVLWIDDQLNEPQPVTNEPHLVICRLDAEATKKLYDVCIGMSVFKKCDNIQTFANGFNNFDDYQPLVIERKIRFYVVWNFWRSIFGSNEERAKEWLQSFKEIKSEDIKKKGLYNTEKDFDRLKCRSKVVKKLYNELAEIL